MKRVYRLAALVSAVLALGVGASTASAAPTYSFTFTYNGVVYSCTATPTSITCVDNATPPNTYTCSKITRSCSVNGVPVTAQDIWSLILGL